MSGLAVRIARPGDAAAVARVLEASYPALMKGAYDEALLARALPLIIRPNPVLLRSGSFYLVEAGGQVVGCGGWTFEAPGSGKIRPGIAHLRHFATDRDWIGRGVGRLLYDRCEADARAAGARILECDSSLNGQDFYSALGFVVVGRIEACLGPGLPFPGIHMRRAL